MGFHVEYLNYYYNKINYLNNEYGLFYYGAVFELLL